MVYLLHFDHGIPSHTKSYKRWAQHYLGYCGNLEERLARHRAGNGARLIEVISAAGIGFELARTWEGDRSLERKLKGMKNSPKRLCPICRKEIRK